MASSHTAERGLLHGKEWQGKYWAQVHRETVFMTFCVQRHYPGLDQNMVYMNNLFLAKQSSSSKTHSIPFSLNLLALQRQDLGGPSNNFPSVSQFIFLFFARIPGQAWCQTLPLRLISIGPRVMFKHTYSLVINTNYQELTCTSVCVSVSSMPPEDGWI